MRPAPEERVAATHLGDVREGDLGVGDALKDAGIQRRFNGRVTVVSVAAPQPLANVGAPGAFGLLPYYVYPEGVEQPGQRNEELWAQHRERVQTLFANAGFEVEFAGVAGEPAAELIEAAEQQDADLIVVGTREPGFLERLLGGSVSQDVARRADCDVLIVHPGQQGTGQTR